MDDGCHFPEGSILRRVHSECAVGLFYCQRALTIGALNPLAFVGTTEHTNAKPRTRSCGRWTEASTLLPSALVSADYSESPTAFIPATRSQ